MSKNNLTSVVIYTCGINLEDKKLLLKHESLPTNIVIC